MQCLLSSPAVDNARAATWRAGHATKDAALGTVFFEPTPAGTCNAMRQLCHAGFASAVAAARATSLAAQVAASAGDASEKVMPMPGLATANNLAKQFATSLDAVTNNVESLGSFEQTPEKTPEEDDWEMSLAVALSLSDGDVAAAAAASPVDDELKLALAMSLTEAGPPMTTAPSPEVPIAEPIVEPVAVVTTPIAEPVVDEPSDTDAKIEPASDDGQDDGVLVDHPEADARAGSEEEEPVWLREAGARLEPAIYAQLNDLREMGFPNDELNERLLLKHDGNLKRTVRALIDDMTV